MITKVLREELAKQLKDVTTPNVNIMGINIKRKVLSELLNTIDSDILSLSTGLVSWDKTEYKTTSHWGSIYNNYIGSVKDEPCLAIDNCRTFVKLLNRPALGDITYINILTGQLSGIESQGIEIDASQFVKAIKNIIFCAAKEQTRPVLQCIYFESNSKTLKLAAADGFRLAESRLNTELTASKFILNASDISRVIKMLSNKDTFKLDIKKDSVVFNAGNSILTLSKQAGDFPNYSQLYPKDNGNTVKVNAKQLYQALKSLNTVKNENNIIRYYFTKSYNDEPDNIKVVGKSEELGEQSADVLCKLSGDDCKVAINRAYMLEALKQCGDNIIELIIYSVSSPVLIKYDIVKYLVMPMNVQWQSNEVTSEVI